MRDEVRFDPDELDRYERILTETTSHILEEVSESGAVVYQKHPGCAPVPLGNAAERFRRLLLGVASILYHRMSEASVDELSAIRYTLGKALSDDAISRRWMDAPTWEAIVELCRPTGEWVCDS